MEFHSQSNGTRTFFEHWWLLVVVAIAILTLQGFDFITSWSGAHWIFCYANALVVAAVGVSLIFYAKLPLYRRRQFLTFGARPLPEHRRSFYRWGWRCVLLAACLLACLFLS
jgi:hypothetical protein